MTNFPQCVTLNKIHPQNVIATWIYIDSPGEESVYPQVGGRSSSLSFQKVYWKCVVNFFVTSLIFNPGNRHILYTNVATAPNYPDLNVRELLERLGVEVVQVKMTYRPPKGYWGSWNNQFYIFDILKRVSEDEAIEAIVILDSDCVWYNSSELLFKRVRECGLIAYDLAHEMANGFTMNGLSLEDTAKLYKEMGLKGVEPKYYGGEFFAATFDRVADIVRRAPEAFKQQVERFNSGNKKFNEEAQLLSYLYQTGEKFCEDGGDFIARIWSNLREHRIPLGFEESLAIIHMPVEKKHGIPRLLNEILQSSWPLVDQGQVRRMIRYHLGLPRRSIRKDVLDIVDKVKEKMNRKR